MEALERLMDFIAEAEEGAEGAEAAEATDMTNIYHSFHPAAWPENVFSNTSYRRRANSC